MERLGASLLAGMPILELDETIERIEAVDADAVGALAAELLRPAATVRRRDRPRRGRPSATRSRRVLPELAETRVIRVGVAGAAGRMGVAACAAIEAAADLELAGRADPALGRRARVDSRATATSSSTSRSPTSALANARDCVAAGVHVVIGTTGFDAGALEGLTGANVFVAPNFAIGAVLMMRVRRARRRATWRPPRSSSSTTTASSTRRAGPRRAPRR